MELPASNMYTHIWVIVDRFTKMAHLVPLPTNTSAKDLAKIFVKEVWKNHGLPTDIVSDRDTKVTSHFWQALMEGPVSLPPRGGPWELLVGVPDANRDRRTRRRLQVCLVPSSGSLWDVNT